jgi:formylglycine-generating enzyme required for sulfatase activity
MKRILIVVMVFALVSSLAVMVGCSKAKVPQAKEESVLVKIEKIESTPKKNDKTEILVKMEPSDKEQILTFGDGIKLEMVLIPAGKFIMGSPASETGRKNDETQHEVTLTKPFYLGKYEVTQEQWKSVMGKNPSYTKGERLPVTNISWNDCQGFIKKLNAKTDSDYRLPTESEWEYACRAGTTTAFSSGDRATKNDAAYGSRIRTVGSYKANGFGLYDMHGNAWEWCEDWYGPYPVGSVTDPIGAAKEKIGTSKEKRRGYAHVLRGGLLNTIFDPIVRSSYRSDSSNEDFIGFRIAKTK